MKCGEHRSWHEIIIYWGDQDEAFIADVPKLPCGASDEATRQLAPANAEATIAEFIETAKKMRRWIP